MSRPRKQRQKKPKGTTSIQSYLVRANNSVQLENDLESQLSKLKAQQRSENQEFLWITVTGLGNKDKVLALANGFGIHPLVSEDILHLVQRPKVEEYDGQILVILRSAHAESNLNVQQISIVLFPHAVLLFSDEAEPLFDSLKTKLIERGLTYAKSVDHLLYLLVDTLVDSYFPVVDHRSEMIEILEEKILGRPGDENTLSEIFTIKRDLLLLKRILWPLRDALSGVFHHSTPLISNATKTFFRDSYDHTLRLIDLVETEREIVSGLLELHISQTNFKINEIMKVMAIISTIFMPLTLITGIYGMNFDTNTSPFNMPELKWEHGYLWVLGLMLFVAGIMIYYVRKKGWLGST